MTAETETGIKNAEGPYPITDYRIPGAKLEIQCPNCGWSYFDYDREILKDLFDEHRSDMHGPPRDFVEEFQLIFVT